MEYFRISKFRAGYIFCSTMTYNSVSTKYTPNEMILQFANKMCPIVNLFSFSIIILGQYRTVIVSIHQHNFIDVLFDDKKNVSTSMGKVCGLNGYPKYPLIFEMFDFIALNCIFKERKLNEFEHWTTMSHCLAHNL